MWLQDKPGIFTFLALKDAMKLVQKSEKVKDFKQNTLKLF